jgi:hypothetical protein
MAIKDTLTTERAASIIAAVYDGSNFSYAGAYALAEWLEEYSDSIGEDIELDPIALCREWSEHPSLYEWAREYFGEDFKMDLPDLVESEWDSEELVDDAIRSYIEDNGTLIEFEGGILVSAF